VTFNPWCLSSYLGLRYVAGEGHDWCAGVAPAPPRAEAGAQIRVTTAAEILGALRAGIERACRPREVGILLSGGIDSAILAALMPEGSPAYTICFDVVGAVDEGPSAGEYARHCGLDQRVVRVTWSDHEAQLERLMAHKRSPLHPVEVGLFMAARAAADDGLTQLVVGNGADSTFGGLDKLLSVDWSFDDFIRRYTFIEPSTALRGPLPLRPVFAPYRRGDGIDVVGFLKHVHGLGIIQAFDNAISAAGCSTVEPYEQLALGVPLDLERIRRGESKYLLREVFQTLYPGWPVPPKIAFARPLDVWLAGWSGPRRAEFLPGLDVSCFSGEQRWLLFCLERFLDMLERGDLR
jgi:asparagine synthetase B (glutamine-hydrolysing)